MALPPFNPDEAIPEDDDIISQYPAIARTFRDIMESWMLVNHDRNGYHSQVDLSDVPTPPGLTNVITIWHDVNLLFLRKGVGGAINIIPQHVYDAAVPGIPNSALQSMAVSTIKGRTAASAGVPMDLTAAQVAAIGAVFTPATPTVVGLKGSVPAPPIDASADGKVLGAAGTWINVGAPHVILEDQKATGVDGGTFTSGAWRKRALTTEVRDPHALAAIVTSDRFTLVAGSYVIKWSAPAFGVGGHVTRLWNVTANALVDAGTPEDCGQVGVGWSEYGVVAALVQTRSFGNAVVTIAATTTFAVEHQAQNTRATDGFGRTTIAQAPTVYTQVDIWKVG